MMNVAVATIIIAYTAFVTALVALFRPDKATREKRRGERLCSIDRHDYEVTATSFSVSDLDFGGGKYGKISSTYVCQRCGKTMGGNKTAVFL